jgi:phospholipase/carboxylesterase
MKKLVGVLSLLLITAFACRAQLQDGMALKYMVQMPAQQSAHPQIIVLMHGYGSDEQDMFGLRNVLPGNYIIIAVRAPYSLPGGGYQWFEKEVVNGKYNGRRKDLDNSIALVVKFLGEAEGKYKVSPKDVYLMGFSQGAIMSYEVGLTHPSLVKGIGVLSGMLFPSVKPMIKNDAALKQLRIFVSHGTADDRLAFTDGKAGVEYLQGLGLRPEFHQYPGMGHTISKEVIADLVKWLK